MFINISILKLKKIYEYNAGIFMFKYVRNELPETFDNMILFMITGQDKMIYFIFQQ